MRAIVLPLSDILYNYEKHSGIAFGERMCKAYPAYEKFANSKIGYYAVIILLAVPVYLVAATLYYWPLYSVFVARFGSKKAKEKMQLHLAELSRRFENGKSKELETAGAMIRRFQSEHTAVFVYYTAAMVPKMKWKKRKFFNKLESMMVRFHVDHVQQANTPDEIETMIWLFDIDRTELLLATMQIEISAPDLVIPFRQKATKSKAAEMAAWEKEYEHLIPDPFYENSENFWGAGQGCCIIRSREESMDEKPEEKEPAFDPAFYKWLYEEGFVKNRDIN